MTDRSLIEDREEGVSLRALDRQGNGVGSRLALAAVLAVVLVVGVALAVTSWRLFDRTGASSVRLDSQLRKVANEEEAASKLRGDAKVSDLLFGPVESSGSARAEWEQRLVSDPAKVAEEGQRLVAQWEAGLGKAGTHYTRAGRQLEEAEKLSLPKTDAERLDAVRETIELDIYSLQLEKARVDIARRGFDAIAAAVSSKGDAARGKYIQTQLRPLVKEWNANWAEQKGITERQQQLLGPQESLGLDNQ